MPIFTKSVAATGDDGHGWAGGVDLTGTNIIQGQDDPGGGTHALKSFLRFTVVDIPPKSIINSGKITVYNASYGGPAGNVYLYGGFMDVDNPSAPTDWAGISALTQTSAQAYNNPGTGTIDLTGLGAGLQTIVNRAGWALGNAVIFSNIDNGSTGDRKWLFNSYTGATPALLTIDYIPPGGELVSITPFMMI